MKSISAWAAALTCVAGLTSCARLPAPAAASPPQATAIYTAAPSPAAAVEPPRQSRISNGDEIVAAARALHNCALLAAGRNDDGISSADVVAGVLLMYCHPEFDGWENAAVRTLAHEYAGPMRVHLRRDANRMFFVPAVLRARALRREVESERGRTGAAPPGNVPGRAI